MDKIKITVELDREEVDSFMELLKQVATGNENSKLFKDLKIRRSNLESSFFKKLIGSYNPNGSK